MSDFYFYFTEVERKNRRKKLFICPFAGQSIMKSPVLEKQVDFNFQLYFVCVIRSILLFFFGIIFVFEQRFKIICFIPVGVINKTSVFCSVLTRYTFRN